MTNDACSLISPDPELKLAAMHRDVHGQRGALTVSKHPAIGAGTETTLHRQCIALARGAHAHFTTAVAVRASVLQPRPRSTRSSRRHPSKTGTRLPATPQDNLHAMAVVQHTSARHRAALSSPHSGLLQACLQTPCDALGYSTFVCSEDTPILRVGDSIPRNSRWVK